MKNDLDKLIDKAVAEYATPEFPPGLEQRVLNRVRASGIKRRFAIPRWAFAVPALALVVVGVAIVRIYNRPLAEPPLVVRIEPKTVPPADWAVKRTRPTGMKHPSKRKPLSLPKQEIFPAPMPMTEEERALVAFVQNAPEQAKKVLSEIGQRGMEPMQIQEINIPPLGSNK